MRQTITRPTAEEIQQAVNYAMEETKARNGAASRLLPFTAAETKFIQELVIGALTRLLVIDPA